MLNFNFRSLYKNNEFDISILHTLTKEVGSKMNDNSLNYLLKKIEQQENIVSQLLQIVANNNKKLIQLQKQVEKLEHLSIFEKI